MNKNNRNVIILGASKSQVHLIKIVKDIGFNTVVVDRDINAPGLIEADHKIIVSTYDDDSIYKEIESEN